MGTAIDSLETNLFSAGIDSLKATQLTRMIRQEVDLGQNSLGVGAVYEHGNIKDLARHLYSLRTGERDSCNAPKSLVTQLISKYSGVGDVVVSFKLVHALRRELTRS
jgi:hypothetical protein